MLQTAPKCGFNDSLSVILPVFNAQATLEARVQQILEVLPELTADFELLIVDDGSTDATEEVAHELAYRFPQVKVVRHGEFLGTVSAVETGLTNTSGQVVLVHNDQVPLSGGDLRQLWAARGQQQPPSVADRSTSARSQPTWVTDLVAWGNKLRKRWQRSPNSQLRMFVDEQNGDEARTGTVDGDRKSHHSAAADQGHLDRKKPNFVAHVKQFALGE